MRHTFYAYKKHVFHVNHEILIKMSALSTGVVRIVGTKYRCFDLILVFKNSFCTHMPLPTILTRGVDESFENSQFFEKQVFRLHLAELIRRSSFDQGLRPSPAGCNNMIVDT